MVTVSHNVISVLVHGTMCEQPPVHMCYVSGVYTHTLSHTHSVSVCTVSEGSVLTLTDVDVVWYDSVCGSHHSL